MSDQEKIEEQPAANRPPPTTDDSSQPADNSSPTSEENKNLPDEDPQSQTISPKLHTEEMEVHHPHHPTHKKKWTEYLLEFLMLFLAVFLGFTAENIREHQIERHREKQYIEGFVQNLTSDIAQLTNSINGNLKKQNAWDSLMSLSDVNLALSENAAKFYDFFIKGSYVPVFRPSDAALLQLKNAGNLRLLTNKNIVDSILSYDAYNKAIVDHNEEYRERGNEMWDAAYPIMQAKIMSNPLYVDFKNRRVIAQKNIPVLTLNPRDLQVFFGKLSRTLLFTEVNRNYMIAQKNRAERLISLLQKQYHLENEE